MNTILQTPVAMLLIKATVMLAVTTGAQVVLRRHASAATRHGVGRWPLRAARLPVLSVSLPSGRSPCRDVHRASRAPIR
jgi:hypothetical protein